MVSFSLQRNKNVSAVLKETKFCSLRTWLTILEFEFFHLAVLVDFFNYKGIESIDEQVLRSNSRTSEFPVLLTLC